MTRFSENGRMQVEKDPTVSGKRVQFAALAAVIITFTCIFIGETAQQFADNLAPAASHAPELGASASQPRFNAIDYATTAAVKGATVIIGPCDAQKTGR
jgi:hypothetical protein